MNSNKFIGCKSQQQVPFILFILLQFCYITNSIQIESIYINYNNNSSSNANTINNSILLIYNSEINSINLLNQNNNENNIRLKRTTLDENTDGHRNGNDDGKLKRNQFQLTEFIDNNGNQYETAELNFCPTQCSCLNDYFECRKMNLKEVPQLPDWVRRLDLTGNKLDDTIEISIANLTQLFSLTLKKNRLHKIPVFKRLNSLEELYLSNNKIQAITIEPFLSMINLRILDISRNEIRTILPNSFPTKNRLTSLNLNYNQITTLGENSFDVLKGLTDLQINKNGLRNLPNGIFKSLNNLRKLSLSENHLQFTWSTFKGLNDLRSLKLKSNGITELSDGVFHALTSIESIELDSNHIHQMNRKGFYNLSTLISLTLSNNSIESMEPNTFECTQNLQIIDLSHNSLIELKTSHFKCLNHLKQLNLNNNNLNYLTDTIFECIENLEVLDLSNNKLSWIIEDVTTGPFKLLKNLQKLNLANNHAKSINQKAFQGLQQLQILNLNYNNLTTIQLNAFNSLPKLQKLIINSEHFICDCNLKWFYNWLKVFNKNRKIVSGSGNSNMLSGSNSLLTTNSRSIVINNNFIIAKCDYPVQLFGKDLLKLKPLNFMCNESPKPHLIKEPSNQLIIKGNNVTLECTAISSQLTEMQIQWRRDNVDIRDNSTENETLVSNDNNSTITTSYLHLYNVSNSQHTGKYQCVVANNFGTTYSQKFKITVSTYPGFRKIPTNVTLQSGYTARLDCSAFGDPKPEIAWQKDGGNDFPAARERRMHVMPADDAFFIINAKTIDMGVYTCTAENPAGIIKANATLIVNEVPQFISPVEISKEILAGESCVLECLSTGSPKPLLQWYKDEKPLKLSDRHYFTSNQQLLVIINTVFSDSGRYKCEIENSLGKKSSNLMISVVRGGISKNVVNVEEMTGIVIITVFCCAVGTSIIWVVIIYQTKKLTTNTSNNINSSNCNNDRNCLGGGGGNSGGNNGNVSINSNGHQLDDSTIIGNGNTLYRSVAASIPNHDNQLSNSLSTGNHENINTKNSSSSTTLPIHKNNNTSFNFNNTQNSNNNNYYEMNRKNDNNQQLRFPVNTLDEYCGIIPRHQTKLTSSQLSNCQPQKYQHQIPLNDINPSPLLLKRKKKRTTNKKFYLNDKLPNGIEDHTSADDNDDDNYHQLHHQLHHHRYQDDYENQIQETTNFDNFISKITNKATDTDNTNDSTTKYECNNSIIPNRIHQYQYDDKDIKHDDDEDDLTRHLCNSTTQLNYNLRRCDGNCILDDINNSVASIKLCHPNHYDNKCKYHNRSSPSISKSKSRSSTPSPIPPPLPIKKTRKQLNEHNNQLLLTNQQNCNNSINAIKNNKYLNIEYNNSNSNQQIHQQIQFKNLQQIDLIK